MLFLTAFLARAAPLELASARGPRGWRVHAVRAAGCGDHLVTWAPDLGVQRVDADGARPWQLPQRFAPDALSCDAGGARLVVQHNERQLSLVDVQTGEALATASDFFSWRWAGDQLEVIRTDGSEHIVELLPEGPAWSLGPAPYGRVEAEGAAVLDRTPYRTTAGYHSPDAVMPPETHRDGPYVLELWTDRLDPGSAVSLAPCPLPQHTKRPITAAVVGPDTVQVFGCLWDHQGRLISSEATAGARLDGLQLRELHGGRVASVGGMVHPRIRGFDGDGLILLGAEAIQYWERDCWCPRLSLPAGPHTQAALHGPLLVIHDRARTRVYRRDGGVLLADLSGGYDVYRQGDGRYLFRSHATIYQIDPAVVLEDPGPMVHAIVRWGDGIQAEGVGERWRVDPGGQWEASSADPEGWRVPQADGSTAIRTHQPQTDWPVEWYTPSGELVGAVPTKGQHNIQLSPAGLLRHSGKKIILEHISSADAWRHPDAAPDLRHAAITDDGATLLVAHQHSRYTHGDPVSITLFQGSAARQFWAELPLSGLTLSPSGAWFAYVSNKVVWVGRAEVPQERVALAFAPLDAPRGTPIRALALSETHLAILEAGGRVSVVSLQTGEVVQRLSSAPLEAPRAALWSVDGGTLWVLTDGQAVETWRLRP